MALNKFMHPNNIYKTPPDFAKLAKTYKEFSDIAKMDVTGKVTIDFKDPQVLRILTTCLLKSDFNLDVLIPEDRLVPTLPLRLNYILWIEDLMNFINKKESITGLDIGTGACAIYPLLAAVKNKWTMVGTETDEESLLKATENVQRNNLQNLITLKQNPTKSIVDFMFADDNSQVFEFCMCNPPFYTNVQELWESRSPARPEPKNGFTGSPHELITEGGELQFCRKIIEESKLYKDRILIYTTMVGHKHNLKELVLDLKAEAIKYTITEFCQGRVTRWGLAWTYQDYELSKIDMPKDKSRKKNLPITITLPKPDESKTTTNSFDKMKAILQELKITYRVITKRNNELRLNITATSNTWSNQRRKRRLQKQIEEQSKKAKCEGNSSGQETKNDNDQNGNTTLSSSVEKNSNDISELDSQQTTQNSKPLDNTSVLINALLKIVIKDVNVNIEMENLYGTAGKEGLHQIAQYIKNNWNYPKGANTH
ncbi:U6 small nuclear RNA (adenine-(43)-N(6))-methyltransferase [Danaus plexippus]|uniref:U6 small nuclear RNA (adenine-(43)-N(6))-methyltransferase n=1 Tax=Danaus plexippus TaxID=13037 RepID=UPI002AB0BAC2|nr:U6 small nuclear RNA (adenine-(43)-N(6))-methyltransferase [Danaus plexippus]